MWTRLAFCVAWLAGSIIALGQPLADKVPADALIYVGWAGTGSAPGYEGSHLQAVLDASNLRQLVDQTLPAVLARIGQEDRDAAAAMKIVVDLGGPLLRYPSAFYFGGVDFTDPRMPSPRVALLCQAGADAPAVVKQAQDLIAQAGPMPVELRAVNQGGLVVVTAGKTPALDQLVGLAQAQAPAALVANEPFKAALGKVSATPAIIAYIDAQGVLKLIDEGVQRFGRPRDQQQWDRVRAGLGLEALRQIIWTGAFADKDWSVRAYIHAPGPRTGVVALLAGQPLSDAALKLVPRGATLASAWRMDLAQLWGGLRQMVTALDPRAERDIARAEAELKQALGFDVATDLLPALGEEWAYYWDPMLGGSGFLSGALVSRPRDPARAEQLLTQLEQKVQQLIDKELRGGKVTVRFQQTQSDGATIHYLAIPAIAPAWALHDGTLYVALYPQVVASAVALHKQGGSILDNERFIAWQKRIGDSPATSGVQYQDMKALAPEGYQCALFLSRTVLGIADLFGIQTPAMVLPPLHALMEHLGPSGAVSWSDEQGMYYRDLSSFPGAQLLAMDFTSGLLGAPAMASVMLPSIGRSRETANRVKCASNMRQLGQAMLLYANENRNKLAPDLGTLLKTQDVGGEVFICPTSGNSLPPDWRQMNVDQQAAWVNQHSSYVYLAKGRLIDLRPDEATLYEKPDNHNRDGINILFGDGHVEFVDTVAAGEMIQKVTGQNPFIDGGN